MRAATTADELAPPVLSAGYTAPEAVHSTVHRASIGRHLYPATVVLLMLVVLLLVVVCWYEHHHLLAVCEHLPSATRAATCT